MSAAQFDALFGLCLPAISAEAWHRARLERARALVRPFEDRRRLPRDRRAAAGLLVAAVEALLAEGANSCTATAVLCACNLWRRKPEAAVAEDGRRAWA